MGTYAGAQRSQEVIRTADERSSLQWAREKIEEIEVGLRDDPGKAYSVEFITAAEILREHESWVWSA